MKIAITGHRPNKLWNDYELNSIGMKKIKTTLQAMISKLKPTTMISGMALGIDTLWAELAIENQIPLIAAIPCFDHSNKWIQTSVDRYKRILESTLTTVHYVSLAKYTPSCMQVRNEWMVNKCDLLIAVWDGTRGGTGNCVRYAEFVKNPCIIINPHTLEVQNRSFDEL